MIQGAGWTAGWTSRSCLTKDFPSAGLVDGVPQARCVLELSFVIIIRYNSVPGSMIQKMCQNWGPGRADRSDEALADVAVDSVLHSVDCSPPPGDRSTHTLLWNNIRRLARRQPQTMWVMCVCEFTIAMGMYLIYISLVGNSSGNFGRFSRVLQESAPPCIWGWGRTMTVLKGDDQCARDEQCPLHFDFSTLSIL